MEEKSSTGSGGVKLSRRNPALHSRLRLRQTNRYESLGKGHRIPLATRQRSWASDFTCRVGMALGEPRNEEKFIRMLPVAMRSDSKDMVGLERGGSRRGNGDRRCRASHVCVVSWVNFVGQK